MKVLGIIALSFFVSCAGLPSAKRMGTIETVHSGTVGDAIEQYKSVYFLNQVGVSDVNLNGGFLKGSAPLIKMGMKIADHQVKTLCNKMADGIHCYTSFQQCAYDQFSNGCKPAFEAYVEESLPLFLKTIRGMK